MCLVNKIHYGKIRNKLIAKAIMKTTELCNNFLKQKTVESRQAFVKQRNYCVENELLHRSYCERQ